MIAEKHLGNISNLSTQLSPALVMMVMVIVLVQT
jgi:hypothetical protein